MSKKLRFWARVEIDGVDAIRAAGLRLEDMAWSISGDGDVFHTEKSIAASSNALVFDVSTDLGDFDFLWIQADGDGIIELETDSDGSVGKEVYTVPLKAPERPTQGLDTEETRVYGAPFVLARDDSYANYTDDFGGGTLDVIEQVRVQNESGTDPLQVFVLAYT